jgi:hypothetical protein
MSQSDPPRPPPPERDPNPEPWLVPWYAPVLSGLVMLMLGAMLMDDCKASDARWKQYEQKQQEVKERCCSCTQTELGQCGRR